MSAIWFCITRWVYDGKDTDNNGVQIDIITETVDAHKLLYHRDPMIIRLGEDLNTKLYEEFKQVFALIMVRCNDKMIQLNFNRYMCLEEYMTMLKNRMGETKGFMFFGMVGFLIKMYDDEIVGNKLPLQSRSTISIISEREFKSSPVSSLQDRNNLISNPEEERGMYPILRHHDKLMSGNYVFNSHRSTSMHNIKKSRLGINIWELVYNYFPDGIHVNLVEASDTMEDTLEEANESPPRKSKDKKGKQRRRSRQPQGLSQLPLDW